jgi:hypothetical protein
MEDALAMMELAAEVTTGLAAPADTDGTHGQTPHNPPAETKGH